MLELRFNAGMGSAGFCSLSIQQDAKVVHMEWDQQMSQWVAYVEPGTGVSVVKNFQIVTERGTPSIANAKYVCTAVQRAYYFNRQYVNGRQQYEHFAQGMYGDPPTQGFPGTGAAVPNGSLLTDVGLNVSIGVVHLYEEGEPPAPERTPSDWTQAETLMELALLFKLITNRNPIALYANEQERLDRVIEAISDHQPF